MFEDMVVSSANPSKTNKPWTVVLSMVFQVVFPRDLDPDSADLHRSAAEDDDGDAPRRASAAAAAAAASGRRAGCARQAAGALDGRGQTRGAEGHPERRQDH